MKPQHRYTYELTFSEILAPPLDTVDPPLDTVCWLVWVERRNRFLTATVIIDDAYLRLSINNFVKIMITIITENKEMQCFLVA